MQIFIIYVMLGKYQRWDCVDKRTCNSQEIHSKAGIFKKVYGFQWLNILF